MLREAFAVPAHARRRKKESMPTERKWHVRLHFAALVVIAGAAATGIVALAADQAIEFRHALDDSPLDVSPIKGETFTEAVKSFHATGTNPYSGNAEAFERGKELYNEDCAACHMPDGTGRIGPSLVDEDTIYPRVKTDVGMFEVIHSGASGAMQSFAQRGMLQDDMLKVMAYVRSLKK